MAAGHPNERCQRRDIMRDDGRQLIVTLLACVSVVIV